MNYLDQTKIMFFSFLLVFVQEIFAVKVTLPYESQRDIVTKSEEITYKDAKESMMNTIKLGNSYLWFSIAILCMGVIIYAGFQMVIARGDDGVVKKSVETLIYAGIGIGVAMMAYTVINLATNFFS